MADNNEKDWVDVPVQESDWKDITVDEYEWKDIISNEQYKKEFRGNRPPFEATGEAIWRGAGQGAFGLGDEAEATVRTAESLSPYIARKLKGESTPEDDKTLLQTYLQEKQKAKQRNVLAEIGEPGAYAGGELLGVAATTIIPGMGFGTGLTRALTSGAIYGGLTGYGMAEPSVLEDPEKVAVESAKGAGTGVLIDKTVKGISKAPGAMKRFAEERAIKAGTGTPGKKFIKQMAQTGKVNLEEGGSTLGRTLLEKDEFGKPAVGWTSSPADVLEATTEKSAKAGEAIGNIIQEIDSLVPNSVSGKNIANRIYLEMGKIPNIPKNSAVISALQREAEYYETLGAMDFAEAQLHKGQYVFKPTDTTTQTLGQDATNMVRKAISNEMENTANEIGNKFSKTNPNINKYSEYKRKYGDYESMQKASEDKALSGLTNRWLSPSDYATGATGALALGAGTGQVGMALGGLPLALLHKVARERGSAFVARGSNAVADFLAFTGKSFGKYAPSLVNAAKRGNAALLTTHYLLSKDPEYNQMFNTILNEEINKSQGVQK